MTDKEGTTTPEQVLDFWFAKQNRPLWFRSTDSFDDEIRRCFKETYLLALDGGLDHFRHSADGALALVILLDQFPLNMFRGIPESFAGEAAARDVADEALRRGFDEEMGDYRKAFLYLPFMHSENLEDQDRSVALFEVAGMANNLRWARHHRDIVKRFGRFPHRNSILGRDSSAAELAWLASPDAFQG